MRLSVVSILARLDLDPWQEAAVLDCLPGETGTERLAALIAALPDEISAHRDPKRIAARLIALLPRLTRPSIPSSGTTGRTGATVGIMPRAILYVYLILMALALCVQVISASHQSAAPAGKPQTPTAGVVTPSVRPPHNSQ